jgi:hypothetical protein
MLRHWMVGIGILTEAKFELDEVAFGRKLLERFPENSAFDWGGDLNQFKPILEKALDHYSVVVVPKWCSEFDSN